MMAYIVDADISDDVYVAIEPHIVGEVLDAGYISYRGEEWTPRRTKIKDARWDEGHCTWGCVCSACGARHEHMHTTAMNYCPNCGAEVVEQ
jgi:hypothetical protein